VNAIRKRDMVLLYNHSNNNRNCNFPIWSVCWYCCHNYWVCLYLVY